MLQGINNHADYMSAYNNIQARRLAEQNMSALNGQAEEKSVSESGAASPVKMDLRLEDIRPRQNASLEDVSLSLNESASTFEMKGRDSELTDLDLEKAISDMQKDQALQQYQYFVGDSNPFASSSDGVVIAK